jgi:hypothetical protein
VPAFLAKDRAEGQDEISVAAGMVPRIRQEVSNRSDLNSLERAEMISSLNERSKLPNARKYIMGEELEQDELIKEIRKMGVGR